MVPKFFGQYLLERGIVKTEQLIEAIEYQEENRQKLGEVAVSREYLTEEQVKRIHMEQQKTDMRFGDLAVKEGYLTESQLQELITIQKNNHIYLGEALVRKGFVSQKTLDKTLDKFKEEQKSLAPENINIGLNHKYEPYIITYIDLVSKLLLRVADIGVKIGDATIKEDKIDVNYLTVEIDTKGAMNSKLLISLTKDAIYEIAEKFLEEKFDDEEIAYENASEFLNVVCGNLATAMEKEGKKIDISVPKIFKGSEKASLMININEKAIVVPFVTTKGYCEVQVLIEDVSKVPTDSSKMKKKVLIVDDSKSVAFKLKKIIEKTEDFEVAYHATSAEEGIEKYMEIKPDLVTMDIVLPGISGIEAIKKIIEKDPKANIIVISSVGGGQEKLFEAIQSGAKNVIVKPFEEERVKDIFRQTV